MTAFVDLERTDGSTVAVRTHSILYLEPVENGNANSTLVVLSPRRKPGEAPASIKVREDWREIIAKVRAAEAAEHVALLAAERRAQGEAAVAALERLGS